MRTRQLGPSKQERYKQNSRVRKDKNTTRHSSLRIANFSLFRNKKRANSRWSKRGLTSVYKMWLRTKSLFSSIVKSKIIGSSRSCSSKMHMLRQARGKSLTTWKPSSITFKRDVISSRRISRQGQRRSKRMWRKSLWRKNFGRCRWHERSRARLRWSKPNRSFRKILRGRKPSCSRKCSL